MTRQILCSRIGQPEGVGRYARTRVVVHVPRRGAACVLLLGLLASACGGSEAMPASEPPATAASSAITISDRDATAAGIETAVVRAMERVEPVHASGVVTLDERRTARVGAFVEGVVSDVHVQPGDSVQAETMLASIHSHIVHDAWAGYFTALANARRAEAEFGYARTAETRAATLVADKALSPQELERARTDVTAARHALAAANAEVTRAEQELRHYGLTPDPDASPREHDHVPILARSPGVVIERLAAPGAAVTPGTPLFVVSDLSRVWIAAEIEERLLGRVAAGSRAIITAAAYPDDTFTGTLAAIGDVINPATRRVTLRIEAANSARRLKPQMFVTVRVESGEPRPVLVVPSRAVQTMEGQAVVFVRTGGDTFVRRPVTVGADIDGSVEIVKGLDEGDVVATAGAFLLKSELVGVPDGEDH